jgi:UDP-glucose 4-epimerase
LLARPGTVLVTGGCGFIGSNLVRRLLVEGHAIRVLDDLSTGSIASLPKHRRVEFHHGSILDGALVRRLARDADVVLHLAGVVGMELATRAPERAWITSVHGTRHVLRAGRAPVVLFSSSAVYGLAADVAGENGDVPRAAPLAYDGGRRGYACGKWEMERIGLRAARNGRDVLVLRPFNVVGPGQTGAYGMVLPRFIDCARRGEPLPIYGDGCQTRCFSDVRTFTDVVLRLLRSDAAWRDPCRSVDVGCGVPTSIEDLAASVLRQLGRDLPVRHLPYENVFPGRRDVLHRVPSGERLERWIGPVAWPDVHTIVARLCRAGRGALCHAVLPGAAPSWEPAR